MKYRCSGTVGLLAVVVGASMSAATLAGDPQRREAQGSSTPSVAPATAPERHVEVRRHVVGPAIGFAAALAPEVGEGLVTGAPYVADAVTEFRQDLADGNRIEHRTVFQVARDGEGRTRREQTLAALGPLALGGEAPRFVFINDPVAGAAYTLDPARRTATKLALPKDLPPGRGDHVVAVPPVAAAGIVAHAVPAGPPPGSGTHAFEIPIETRVENDDRSEGAPERRVVRRHVAVSTMAAPAIAAALETPTEEPLGTREVNGVEARGTRLTTTIPAGAIGNVQPITIVTERWYAPALKTVVLTRHSDPRTGETTYQLTNIRREDPAADLFTVPADYTVNEAPKPAIVHIERKPRDQ